MGNYKATENNVFLRFFRQIYLSYIPNKRDNVKQILIKILFIVSLAALIISASYITKYFLEADKQNGIIEDSRKIWHSNVNVENENPINVRNKAMLAENGDFKGWITLEGTQVDNPIYQTTDNSYYLNHNQKKKYSAYGALFFDSNNVIAEENTDMNLVIYGHEMKNGSMFGSLKKLKNLNFYKENPTVKFSTLYKDSTYKIYSIFILNAKKSDDDNYIYNISRNSFYNDEDFNSWTKEAYERSIINTNVDVEYGDNIITLVTCSQDFKDARLVIMARETRVGETESVDTSSAVVNPNPRYPKRWYTERGIKK